MIIHDRDVNDRVKQHVLPPADLQVAAAGLGRVMVARQRAAAGRWLSPANPGQVGSSSATGCRTRGTTRRRRRRRAR